MLERFRNTTNITADAPVGPTRSIIEIIDDLWKNVDRDFKTRCLTKRLQRIDKEMDRAKACLEFERFGIEDGDVAKYAKALPGKLKRNFGEAMKLLREKEFQNLLLNYPRPPKGFFVA